MSELIVQGSPLTFLPKTFRNEYEVGQYIGDVYVESFYNIESSYLGDSIHIPSKRGLLWHAWDIFELIYMKYIENGHGGYSEQEVRERLRNGEEIDTIFDEWADIKDFNAAYQLYMTEDKLEIDYLQDVALLLNHFNMSYLCNKDNDSIFSVDEEVQENEWINPPIKGVW